MATTPVKGETENYKTGSTSSASSCGTYHGQCPYKEVYYLGLGSQPNIYCACKLDDLDTGYQKLFVASLRGKVSCLENNSNSLSHGSAALLQASEVYFTYIPGDAEIISLSGFCKQSPCIGKKYHLVIGITLILIKSQHGDQHGAKHFFNIYIYTPEETSNTSLDKTTQICQHKLNFTPYQLTSASIYSNEEYESVFLLSGSDGKIHMYKEDNDGQKFVKQPCEDYFPEFNDLPSNATWIDTKDCNNGIRVSAVGCQSGYFCVTLVDAKVPVVLNSWSFDQDGPISSMKLLSLHSHQSTDSVTEDGSTESGKLCNASELNLLVTSALEVAVVYLQVADYGLSKMTVLPRSDGFDSVTCSLVADVDLDGANEILLGTYGQELLAYKWHRSVGGFNDMTHFDLLWSRSFSKPLFAVESIDLLNDGFLELAVVSLSGVHVLQHDVNHVAELALKLLEERLHIKENEDDIDSISSKQSESNLI